MIRIVTILTIVVALLSGPVDTKAQTARHYEYAAEWEPHEAVWLGFRSREASYDAVTIPMLRALSRHVDVRLVIETDSLLPHGIGGLASEGVDTSRIRVFVQSPTDVWFRDPGPVFLRGEGGLAVADFLYSNYANMHPDSFSAKAIAHGGIDRDVAGRLGLPTVPSRVVMEGGSIEVNGRGTLILSELTRRRNPHLTREEIEEDLKRTLGQRKVIWLREGLAEDPQNVQRIVDNYYGVGTGGHTDEFVRFVNDSTVMLAWVEEAERDAHSINALNHDRMSENFDILNRATDQDGRPLRVLRVPLPHLAYEEFELTEDRLPRFQQHDSSLVAGSTVRWVAAASYLNYVITDGLVLLPKYWRDGKPASWRHRDEEVRRLFESLFPGREIVQIDVLSLNNDGGGMHCLVQQQPRFPRSPAADPSLRSASGDIDPAGPVGIDIGAIATAIVRRSARVQPGELVWIEGGSEDVAFMERLAVAAGAEGGLPIVTLYSEEMIRRWYQEVPERFDTQRDEWLWQLYEKADVVIRLHSIDYSVYNDIPPERLAASDAANAGVSDLVRTRGVRVVRVGNGLHPSEWRARMLGVERAELERIFHTGLLTDPAAMAASGERLREILRGASSVRVQHPNGTDITVGTGRGHVVLSDGSTSLAPRSDAEADLLNVTWLPGGEVTLGLDPDRAEGRLVVERFFLDGQAIGPVTLIYAGGRLEALESESDLSILRAYLDPAVPLTERLTGLKFGLNPDVTDVRVLPWMGSGMFSFSMGSNRALGGDIDLPFMFFLTLAGATVHVDDRLIVQHGVLQH